MSIDSTSSASSSSNNEPPKSSISNHSRSLKKHSTGPANHYKSLNTLTPNHHHNNHRSRTINTNNNNNNNNHTAEHKQRSSPTRNAANHRAHPPKSNHLLSKPISSSVADLSLSLSNTKMSSSAIRVSTFPSKLDYCNNECYKKIPLAQNYDWGILAITNTDLILLYNKDKNSLVIFDSNGHENEVTKDCFLLSSDTF